MCYFKKVGLRINYSRAHLASSQGLYLIIWECYCYGPWNKSSYPSHLLLASLLTPAAGYLDLLQGQTLFKAANLHQEMDHPLLATFIFLSVTCRQVLLQPQGIGLEEYLDQPHTLT